MEKIEIVFCVLTYKNHLDLIEFIKSINTNDQIDFSYKIIVINNFSDQDSYHKIKHIAEMNNCDFINSENYGYGHGNNLGIDLALQNYNFDYLVVCNPDVEIKQFKIEDLSGQENKIIAPEIIARNGKKQNPMNFNYMPLNESLMYIGYKKNMVFLLYLGILINKITRTINNVNMSFSSEKSHEIYACHGSFIIFSSYVVKKLVPIFDNNIFLFCEEGDLARKAKKLGISSTYNKNIIINHKEDGSMNLSNTNLNDVQKDSYIYYYKKWNFSEMQK